MVKLDTYCTGVLPVYVPFEQGAVMLMFLYINQD